MRCSEISLMCSKPSVPGKSSTNAPNSARRTTLPRYVLPTSALAVTSRTMARAASPEAPLVEKRGVSRNLRARRVESPFHRIENLEARFFRLSQSFAHHGNADAEDFDVHLQRGNTVARPGNFEVHVAVM